MKQNKPSHTAMLVANGIYYNIFHKSISQDIPAEMKKLYLELHQFYYGNSFVQKAFLMIKAFFLQFLSIPGLYLHLLLRKKCIYSKVVNLIESGYEQVISLGAGYDILCTLLSDKYPNLKFIDIDHPATSGDKIELFNKLGWQKENMSYLAYDLTSEKSPFEEYKINTTLKTIIICEGLLMYLEEKHIKQLLSMLKTEFQECKLIFTFIEEQEDGNYMFKNATGLVKWWLKFQTEPFKWGIKLTKLEEFVKQNGWSLLDVYDYKKLKDEFLSKINNHYPLAIGENIVICG